VIEVSEICDRLNARAASLAPQLLPNGRRAGNVWQFSGIDDAPGGGSAWLYLAGPQQGHWQDAGSARAGEEKGDMLDLVQLRECGGDKRRAVEWAKAELGLQDDFAPGQRPQMSAEERARRAEDARQRAEQQQAELDKARAGKARNARRLFLSAAALAGSPAEFYLLGRQVPDLGSWPGSLRFHAETWCGPIGGKRPAMISGIFNAAGEQIGAHRTFLMGPPWTKLQHADLADPKMVLGNQWGGFVPINKGASGKSMRDMPEGEAVYVTEGIEDALCVRAIKPAARIVCALNLGNIGAIVLPAAARRLILVCDRDDKPKAVDTLERAIARQQARGLEVKLVMPPPGVKDINDWVRAPAPAPRPRHGVAA
jgi:hypothetical protein